METNAREKLACSYAEDGERSANDVAQRGEDKRALAQPGMGNREGRAFDPGITVEEDVEVQRTGRPARRGSPAELPFDGLELAEEIPG